MSNTTKKTLFIVPSFIGILLFMIPVKFGGSWTVIVKIIADMISGAVGSFLPILCLGILSVSAVMSILAQTRINIFWHNKILRETFLTSPFWTIVRVAGCILAWITYLDRDTGRYPVISGADQGSFILNDLLCTLVIIFAIAGLLLPLLLDFGLLEFIGAITTKYMRPLFTVPGRAAVDCITSWIGDGTLGVMLTCNQFESGYYSEREAAVIATTFSAVSITFSLVVLDQVGLVEMFGIYYLIIVLVGIVCALICPRIPPLSRKKDRYFVEGKHMPENIPEEYSSSAKYGMKLAMDRVSEHKGIGEFLTNGLINSAKMWFGVLPTVMCIGTIALVIANYTPVFEWMGIPFRPLMYLLQVPDANAAASTIIVGFVDMFTPSILIAGAGASAMTRFIIAVVSVTQVLYISEIGGLILASKLPVSLLEMFLIFLERTVISLVIVCPIAHLLF
ncbi:nucleoside recognition GATE domain-containing membrane protein YjiH [Lachnospiraceae bacterium]|nr:nucleoside recognition GATE domain-containing membrane protein YjiH [Lachnospiraceae bacterium]